MANSTTVARAQGLGATLRQDAWWASPLAIFLGLGAFMAYATWAAFQGDHYEYGPYLSPFYAPRITAEWWNYSPAFLVIWIPVGFRGTCYFCRKVYYRAFFLDPPACAVGEHRKGTYCGENKFPFVLQNVHRYFMYLALLFIFFHWVDVVHACNFDGEFGIGVGTLVIFADAFLLSLYVFSCHSLRHLVGGHIDCFSCARFGGARRKTWEGISILNRRHGLWFWLSMVMVGLADLYIRLCAMGIIKVDVRII